MLSEVKVNPFDELDVTVAPLIWEFNSVTKLLRSPKSLDRDIDCAAPPSTVTLKLALLPLPLYEKSEAAVANESSPAVVEVTEPTIA